MFRSPLLPYFALVGTSTMGIGAVFTMLGEFRDQLGVSETGLGIMVAVGFFAPLVSQVALARYADRGHGQAMIRIGLVLLVCSHLAMATATGLWQLMVARVLLGLGLGLIFPSVRRIVIVHDSATLGANLGALGAFDVGGFAVGPLAAAVFVEAFGFRAPFVVMAIVTAAFVPFVARTPDIAGAAGAPKKVVRQLLGRREIRATLVVAAGWFAMIGAFESVWAVLLTDLGAATWMIGVTLTIIVVPMIVLAPIGGRLAQRFGPLRTAALGVLVAVPCVVAYGFVRSVVLLAVIATLQGAGDAVTFPATQVSAAMAAGESELAAAQGLLSATLQLVAGTVALGAGASYEAWGAEPLFVATGAMMVGGVALAFVIARPLTAARDPLVFGDRPAAPALEAVG